MAGTEPSKDVVIAVDAMGGDHAPQVVVEGCEQALAADSRLTVLLAGPDEVVTPFCERHERARALIAPEVIAMGEHPAEAVRRKRSSSIVLGCKAVKGGEAEGFFSAGSTGACLAAATLYTGRVKGVQRPAIATILPCYQSRTVLTDAGANADCKPEYLLQFAQMGAAYARIALGVEHPRVGLLNIGAEEAKGSEFAVQVHQLLAERLPEFAGNAEGGDLLAGTFDVVVTDGFTGNVALKTAEGTAKAMGKLIKDIFYGSAKGKIAGALVHGQLSGLKSSMGSEAVGGSPLLGVRGAVFIGHGSSNATAIASGIAQTAYAAQMDLAGEVAQAIGS